MMNTWDDIDSTSSEKDEEHATNLCLMADLAKYEVFDSESDMDISNQKVLEQIF